MEMTRAEAAAVAAVDGMPAELLDAMGRLVVTPHALTQEGQRNVPVDLQPGESLSVFLGRHVPGIESGAWVVSIGGAMVPRAMWAHVYPKHGMHIACRAVVAKQAVALVAIAALTYFSGGLAAGLYGAMGGTYVAASAGFALAAIQAGIVIAGSMLINKVLGPKVPKAGDVAAARQVHSIASQRNSARLYEPLPVLWGEMRVTPDLASKSYTWNEGDDQYLGVRLLGGINVFDASGLAVGDTALSSYDSVDTYFSGFPGHPNQDIPLSGNVDSIAGGELPDAPNTPVLRTSSADAVALGVDLEYMLYHQGDKGIESASVQVIVEYAPAGSGNWVRVRDELLTNNDTSPRRISWQFDVPAGQYDVRVQRSPKGGNDKTTRQVAWASLRSIQPDSSDYGQWGCIGIKIKATGQLSGSLDTVRATYRAKPMPIWTGAEWATATTRDDGLSNPGAIILQTLRGVYAKDRDGNDVLQWGYGMSDEQIDIEGLKAFMLHCNAKGYTYDRWVTQQMSLQQFCDEVALAGMGQFTWTDGSRPTVAFVSSGQPIGAVVNMANMKKAGFSVDYVLSNAADGIEYQYLDRNTWETNTLRVAAPGVTTMLNPAQLTGEGVTSEAHAAVLARYHLAQSLFQFKTVHFQADIEHLDYRRLSVLSVSHDLTQWGFGGRVMAAEIVDGKIRLQLDDNVPPLETPHMGLRIPGERDYRVWPMVPMAEASDVVELVGEWPAGVAFPGDELDNPAHDTLWCADFKATPGYRVRVIGIEPERDLSGAAVSCVPEGPEFWDYVLNGSYVPAPSQSAIPQLGRPSVSNLRVTEQVNVQGDTEWSELHVVWDAAGAYDHAQVWAGRDGAELRLVDGNATGTRSKFRIDGAGEWLVDVRPFNASGQVGSGAQVLYITTATQIPPRNVDQFVVQPVAGGLRRFAWQYTGDKPPAFAGVQIRYAPGDVALSTADWDGMTPLGEAADVYAAQFETTRPQAGLWTFGCRAIDTAGQLSPGVRRFAIRLDDSFEQVQQPDRTPPPAPANVLVAPLMTTAMVAWDAPAYVSGHGHKHSVIYTARVLEGQPLPTLAGAKSVMTTAAVPCSIPVDMGADYMLWVRHVSNDDVQGAASEPVRFVTAQDVGQLLDLLAGKVGPQTLTSDVVDELSRISDLSADLDGVKLQLADIQGAEGYDPLRESYPRGALVTEGGKLYRAMQDVPQGVAPPNASYWQFVGDFASLGDAVAAHSIQLQNMELEVDQLGKAVSASASSVQEMSARLRDTDDDALLADVLNQWDSHAQIKEERVVRATQTEAEAAARLQLQAQVEGQFAAVTQQFTAQAGINGYQAAKYALAVTVGAGDEAVVGGMQIAGTSSEEQGPRIAIQFAADILRIVSPDGSKTTSPFYVQTADTVENGVTVPAGVYIGSATIGNVDALWGRFGSLRADTIQATALSASQLTAGNGVIGGTLKSANYVAGSSGWTLRPDGVAEFSGVIVRGTIYATSGTVGGIVTSFSGIRSSNYDGIGAGFSIGSDGKVDLPAGSVTARALAVTSLSAVSANLGEVTAGIVRSPDYATYINLNAQGSDTAFQVGGGKFIVRANGYAEADRVNIRRREVMATGSVYWGKEWIKNGETGVWNHDLESGLLVIDTGIDVADGIDFALNQPFHAIVSCTSTFVGFGNIGSARAFELLTSAQTALSASHYANSGNTPGQVPRIKLVVRTPLVNVDAAVARIRLNNFNWSLFRI